MHNILITKGKKPFFTLLKTLGTQKNNQCDNRLNSLDVWCRLYYINTRHCTILCGQSAVLTQSILDTALYCMASQQY